MTKRFKLHIDWFNYDKTDGEATLSDNGQPLLESDCVEDMRRLKDLLNELSDENEQLKQSNQKVIEFILDGIVEMHDGKRDYAETLFNKAIRLLKGDVE